MSHPTPSPGVRPPAGRLLAAALLSAVLAAGIAVAAGRSAAEPATTTPVTPSTPSTPSTVASDTRGYPGTAAHCAGAQSAAAYGRTVRSLVAICVDRDGSLEYRGQRLRDAAALTMPAGRTADGAIVATNDGVTYAVTSTVLLVSEGDSVLYRDPWIEFREPRFDDSTPAPSSAAGTPTVSTTTVTMTPTATTAEKPAS